MKDFHPEQLSILQKLLYSDGLKYSHIKPIEMEGSSFTFHLDQLLKNNYIVKDGGKYHLTNNGKEFANQMDLGDTTVNNQAKISVIMVCKREIEGKTEYLLYTRRKSPFYGYQGFPTGKVKKGENISDAAKRELKEETGLEGDPKLFAIRHYKIFDDSRKLLEDKIFFAFRFLNPVGELEISPEGKFDWINKDEVWDYLKNPVNEIKEIFENIDNESLTFKESEYSTDGF